MTDSFEKRACLLALVAALLFPAARSPSAWIAARRHLSQGTADYIRMLEDPARDKWQKPQEVIASLELRSGDAVADLGSGSGYFTLRLARAVGPTGKVYAIDIEPEMLDYVAGRTRREHVENVQTVLADPHDPKLAPASVDVVFICDTLHHISEREKYYPLLALALKPGGRLVDIDFEKRPLPFGPPIQMRIAKQAVIEEMISAGFRLKKDFDFLEYQYFLVFER